MTQFNLDQQTRIAALEAEITNLQAENAALRKWSRAWKQAAKKWRELDQRDFMDKLELLLHEYRMRLELNALRKVAETAQNWTEPCGH